jgi:ABC-2 type transport system permease protein
MRAARAITVATIRQVLGVRRAILFGLAMTAPALVFLLTSQTVSEGAALDRLVFMVVTLYLPLLVPIVSLIISASALGDERRDGTLSFLVLRPVPRSVIAGSKFLGAALVAAALNALGGAALGVVYGIETGVWGPLLPLIVGGVVAGTVYTALFVPLGFFTDRAVLAGLAFVLVFENGVVSALSGLAVLSPWRLGLAAFSALSSDAVTAALTDLGIPDLPGFGMVVLRTVLIVAVSIAATTLVLRRRDLA